MEFDSVTGGKNVWRISEVNQANVVSNFCSITKKDGVFVRQQFNEFNIFMVFTSPSLTRPA